MLVREMDRIQRGHNPVEDFVFGKKVRLGTYHGRNLPAAAIVARQMIQQDPRSEPAYGEVSRRSFLSCLCLHHCGLGLCVHALLCGRHLRIAEFCLGGLVAGHPESTLCGGARTSRLKGLGLRAPSRRSCFQRFVFLGMLILSSCVLIPSALSCPS